MLISIRPHRPCRLLRCSAGRPCAADAARHAGAGRRRGSRARVARRPLPRGPGGRAPRRCRHRPLSARRGQWWVWWTLSVSATRSGFVWRFCVFGAVCACARPEWGGERTVTHISALEDPKRRRSWTSRRRCSTSCAVRRRRRAPRCLPLPRPRLPCPHRLLRSRRAAAPRGPSSVTPPSARRAAPRGRRAAATSASAGCAPRTAGTDRTPTGRWCLARSPIFAACALCACRQALLM